MQIDDSHGIKFVSDAGLICQFSDIRKALSAAECNCENMPTSIATFFSPDLYRVHILTSDSPGKTPNPRNLRVI
jgi:hypothetical protein